MPTTLAAGMKGDCSKPVLGTANVLQSPEATP
jgi:hypothetical protein